MSRLPIPFCLYSDGPHLSTGLARIARDLASRIWADRDRLGVDLLQAGLDPLPGFPMDWPVYAAPKIDTEGDWGAGMLQNAWLHYFGSNRPDGVLFSIWDPGRSYALLEVKGPTSLWGYFPVDATNVHGGLSGPAGEAVARYQRVLGYGRWGSQVLKSCRSGPVPYLPHGLDLDLWGYRRTQAEFDAAGAILQPREDEVVIGCVATNQPRKDLGLYFATLAELRRRGRKVRGWLHTDKLVRAWSVQQLVTDFGLARKVTVTLQLDDEELAACYALCGCTIAPGLGEGFGYPIVESLACGTPVVHGDYAGGAELVPLNMLKVPMTAERLESVYALRRPVFDPVDMANAVERALDWKRNDEPVCQAYCRASVRHLGWDVLWPRWRGWINQGLEELR
jgi:glycosyltransferase involved in cell wall biosynthesis